MSQGLFLDYVYIVLDVVMLALGLLFVWKWGKRGLLALTLWLFVIGLMALTAGDMLATMADNYGASFVINGGGYYQVSATDFAYIPAVIIWIIAFAIPVKFAFSDSKKLPQGGQGQAPAMQQPAPQMPQVAPQQQAPPAGPQYQGQPPQPAYRQQAPPPAYQQAPPAPYEQQQSRPPYPQQPQK